MSKLLECDNGNPSSKRVLGFATVAVAVVVGIVFVALGRYDDAGEYVAGLLTFGAVSLGITGIEKFRK